MVNQAGVSIEHLAVLIKTPDGYCLMERTQDIDTISKTGIKQAIARDELTFEIKSLCQYFIRWKPDN